MKNAIRFLLVALLVSVNSCRPPVPPDPVPFVMPYFNQVNSNFDVDEIQCLLDHWYARTYQEERPIVFRVINDADAYNAFFACKASTALQQIDFSRNSLLVGMKADNGDPVNTPVNISKMEQNLTQAANGDYVLKVTVTGKQSTSGVGGGEWFGFTSIVPKIQSKVTLEMNYQFE